MSPRRKASHNLLTATVNAAIEQGLLGLDKNKGPLKATHGDDDPAGPIYFHFKLPDVPQVLARLVGDDRGVVYIQVSANPRRATSKDYLVMKGQDGHTSGDAVILAWLNRDWILPSVTATHTYVSDCLKGTLAAMDVEPKGFCVTG